MSWQCVVRMAALGMILAVGACGRSTDEAAPAASTSPANAEEGASWAVEQVNGALSRHGASSDDTWTSSYWSATSAGEQRLVIEGLKASFVPDSRVIAGSAAGAWAGHISFTASAHRIDEAPAEGSPESAAGPGPLGLIQVYVQRKPNGSTFWAGGSPESLATATLSLSPNQQDVLDSTLQEFQHPDTSVAQRTASHHISVALRHDAAAARATGAGPNQPPAVNASYIEKANAIDLSQCPPEFAAAYKEHIQAWRDANKPVIESTWARIETVAHRFMAGTTF